MNSWRVLACRPMRLASPSRGPGGARPRTGAGSSLRRGARGVEDSLGLERLRDVVVGARLHGAHGPRCRRAPLSRPPGRARAARQSSLPRGATARCDPACADRGRPRAEAEVDRAVAGAPHRRPPPGGRSPRPRTAQRGSRGATARRRRWSGPCRLSTAVAPRTGHSRRRARCSPARRRDGQLREEEEPGLWTSRATPATSTPSAASRSASRNRRSRSRGRAPAPADRSRPQPELKRPDKRHKDGQTLLHLERALQLADARVDPAREEKRPKRPELRR